MPYEMKDNKFEINYNAENENTKFPALKAAVKINGEKIEMAAWVKTGQYGKSFSGDAGSAIRFLLAMFGRVKPEKKESPTAPAQTGNSKVDAILNPPPPIKPEPIDRKSLLR